MDDNRSVRKHGFGMSISETERSESSGSLGRSLSQEKLKNGAETTTKFENYGLLYKGGVLVKQPAPTSVCALSHKVLIYRLTMNRIQKTL